MKPKLIRTSTVPMSLNFLLKGQLAFLNQYYDVIGVSGNGDDLDEVARRERVRVIPVEMQRTISPIKDLQTLILLYKIFKKERPDIVHSITPKAGLLSMLAAYFAGVPLRLHTFTGLIFPTRTGLMQKLLILMDRLLCACATNIYPEGEGVKQDLMNYRITGKPLKVLANGNVNGINLEDFDRENISMQKIEELKTELKIASDDFVFVFVGRLVRDKGLNEAVTAFCKMYHSNKQIKFLLVGPYEEQDVLKPETLEAIKTHPGILAAGSQQDIRAYLALSDVLLFPSYREGFPNVVMQAGAMELPVIATDINGCNEIIIDGLNGLLIPAKNSTAIYESMLRIMTDKPFLLRLKSNARQKIVDRYEQKIVWNAIFEEYQRIQRIQ